MDGQDPQLGNALAAASTTRDVVIAADCLPAVPDVLDRTAPAKSYALVADANTWEAAGGRLAALLKSAGVPLDAPFVLAGRPRVKASAEVSRDLAASLRASKALPIAVGSGVINDLV